MAETGSFDTSPRAARAGLSAEAIVEAAMFVADRDGLDAVSIRRVAALLGVRPMSLYTHIASKDELVARMTNELIGLMLIDPLPNGDWRAQLSASARNVHATFIAHPWALAAFARRLPPGPNATAYAKQLARAVAELDLAADDMWMMLGIVNDFVLGHAMRSETAGVARDLDAGLTGTDLADLPELVALPDFDDARRSADSFETGLQTVLDGCAMRFARSASAASGSAQPA